MIFVKFCTFLRHLICIFAHFCIFIWSRFPLFLYYFRKLSAYIWWLFYRKFLKYFSVDLSGTFHLISDYSDLISNSVFPVLFINVNFAVWNSFIFHSVFTILNFSFSSFFINFKGVFAVFTGRTLSSFVLFSPKLAGTYMGSPLAPIICCTHYQFQTTNIIVMPNSLLPIIY